MVVGRCELVDESGSYGTVGAGITRLGMILDPRGLLMR